MFEKIFTANAKFQQNNVFDLPKGFSHYSPTFSYEEKTDRGTWICYTRGRGFLCKKIDNISEIFITSEFLLEEKAQSVSGSLIITEGENLSPLKKANDIISVIPIITLPIYYGAGASLETSDNGTVSKKLFYDQNEGISPLFHPVITASNSDFEGRIMFYTQKPENASLNITFSPNSADIIEQLPELTLLHPVQDDIISKEPEDTSPSLLPKKITEDSQLEDFNPAYNKELVDIFNIKNVSDTSSSKGNLHLEKISEEAESNLKEPKKLTPNESLEEITENPQLEDVDPDDSKILTNPSTNIKNVTELTPPKSILHSEGTNEEDESNLIFPEFPGKKEFTEQHLEGNELEELKSFFDDVLGSASFSTEI